MPSKPATTKVKKPEGKQKGREDGDQHIKPGCEPDRRNRGRT